jgi:hypothetical protein
LKGCGFQPRRNGLTEPPRLQPLGFDGEAKMLSELLT